MGLMERVNCSLKREEWETVIDLSLAQHLARIQGCRIVVWDGADRPRPSSDVRTNAEMGLGLTG
jgi:hypothetical protein